MHPLLDHLLTAARGTFPHADGRITVLPPLRDGTEAVVCFTGHAYVATRLTERDLQQLGADGLGGARSPRVVLAMAAGGSVGTEDLTTVAFGLGGGTLPRRVDLDDHPRVQHARAVRNDVRVFGNDEGLVTVSRGLADRVEIGVEVFTPGRGDGKHLISEATRLVPAGTAAFAAVSPGNTRSVRAFLAAGFTPLGSEVIVQPTEENADEPPTCPPRSS